MVLMSLRLLYR